jgi:hypothetical protein
MIKWFIAFSLVVCAGCGNSGGNTGTTAASGKPPASSLTGWYVAVPFNTRESVLLYQFAPAGKLIQEWLPGDPDDLFYPDLAATHAGTYSQAGDKLDLVYDHAWNPKQKQWVKLEKAESHRFRITPLADGTVQAYEYGTDKGAMTWKPLTAEELRLIRLEVAEHTAANARGR